MCVCLLPAVALVRCETGFWSVCYECWRFGLRAVPWSNFLPTFCKRPKNMLLYGQGANVSKVASGRLAWTSTPPKYYEARHDYTNNSEIVLLCNTRACKWKSIPREFLCNISFHRKYHLKAAAVHKLIPANQEVLCNRYPVQLGINSDIGQVCA